LGKAAKFDRCIFHGLTLYDGSKVREKAAPYNSE
jgi:hypothetical protein